MRHEWKVVSVASLAMVLLCLTSTAKESVFFGWFALASGYSFALYTGWYGLQIRRVREGRSDEPDAFGMHRTMVMLTTMCIFAGVLGIEIGVRKAGGLFGDMRLVVIHLTFALLMLTCFVLARFKFTGERNAQHHRYCVYGFLVTYTLALGTGTILTFRYVLS